ncbi:MAG: DUF4915 domain-containing protein [Bacteroidetes bacterium]|nr:DUF4915 domain-containing protein [Bacteroidota bacterium]
MNNNITMEEAWLSWKEFNKVVSSKKIVFFGVSFDWTAKTFAKSIIDLAYYVDNSPKWIGNTYNDIEVKHPDILKERSSNIYVVVTSAAYESIYPQLIELGLTPGKDFCFTPALNNLKIISDINTHDVTLLISSPDHKIYTNLDKDSNIGGGLYTFNVQSLECKKVLDGTYHQIVDTGKEYFIVDEMRGICQISKDFELIDVFGIDQGDRPHGVAYCPKRNIVLIAQTGKDKITAYDITTKKRCFSINLSGKNEKNNLSNHWMNDLCVHGDYLYVSMFSHSGCCMEGLTDGGILQIDLDNPEIRSPIIQNAWMPHTVRFFDSEICYLDSMRGNFYKTDKLIVGEFHGFIRGLDYDGVYYFIGQSETRYFDRLKGLRKNISMSAGFYMFDIETKAAKFYNLPQIRQVHDLCVIS